MDLNLVTRLCLLKRLKILYLRNKAFKKRKTVGVLFIICLKTVLIVQVRTAKLKRIMNGKGCKKKCPWPNLRCCAGRRDTYQESDSRDCYFLS